MTITQQRCLLRHSERSEESVCLFRLLRSCFLQPETRNEKPETPRLARPVSPFPPAVSAARFPAKHENMRLCVICVIFLPKTAPTSSLDRFTSPCHHSSFRIYHSLHSSPFTLHTPLPVMHHISHVHHSSFIFPVALLCFSPTRNSELGTPCLAWFTLHSSLRSSSYRLYFLYKRVNRKTCVTYVTCVTALSHKNLQLLRALCAPSWINLSASSVHHRSSFIVAFLHPSPLPLDSTINGLWTLDLRLWTPRPARLSYRLIFSLRTICCPNPPFVSFASYPCSTKTYAQLRDLRGSSFLPSLFVHRSSFVFHHYLSSLTLHSSHFILHHSSCFSPFDSRFSLCPVSPSGDSAPIRPALRDSRHSCSLFFFFHLLNFPTNDCFKMKRSQAYSADRPEFTCCE